jgi:hypothetical protein
MVKLFARAEMVEIGASDGLGANLFLTGTLAQAFMDLPASALYIYTTYGG